MILHVQEMMSLENPAFQLLWLQDKFHLRNRKFLGRDYSRSRD